MKSWNIWVAHLGLAGVCLIGFGCGGSAPDPDAGAQAAAPGGGMPPPGDVSAPAGIPAPAPGPAAVPAPAAAPEAVTKAEPAPAPAEARTDAPTATSEMLALGNAPKSGSSTGTADAPGGASTAPGGATPGAPGSGSPTPGAPGSIPPPSASGGPTSGSTTPGPQAGYPAPPSASGSGSTRGSSIPAPASGDAPGLSPEARSAPGALPPGMQPVAAPGGAMPPGAMPPGAMPPPSDSNALAQGIQPPPADMMAANTGGADANAKDSYTNPYAATTSFLNALKAKNLDRLAEATALHAPTESKGKNQKLFQAILDQSLADEDLSELAKSMTGYQIAGQNAPISTGRIGIIVMKPEGTSQMIRTITCRHEKKGWKVVDISGKRELEKPIMMPRMGGMRGGGGRR